jgi:hypothetical protein
MDKRLWTASLILPTIALNQHEDFIVLLVTEKLLELKDNFFSKM